ncbi:hypothetical protein RYA05_02110 [Pseudomonas syringae pv. actinidiae]|nr:hypothetical protein [Pseudomonas syringae pv. actinidiae]
MSDAPIELVFVIWTSPKGEIPFCYCAIQGSALGVERMIEWSKRLVARQWMADNILEGLAMIDNIRRDQPTNSAHALKIGDNSFSICPSPEGGLECTARTARQPRNIGSADIAVTIAGNGSIGVNLPSGDKVSRAMALDCINQFIGPAAIQTNEFFGSNKAGQRVVDHGVIQQISLGGARRRFEYRPDTI